MKPSTISSFAAGLLLAAAISSVAYYVTKEDTPKAAEPATTAVTEDTNTEAVKTPTVEEMEELLASSGYVVQTKEEAEKTETQWQEKVDAAKKSASEDTESNGDVVYRTSIYVSNGMTSIDVGNALKDADIIKMSGFEFSKEVEKKGVEKYLKPGSYKIDSSMSTNKIISTIFQKQ
ncbi:MULTISPECIES: endolytic transglycosylase MltG [Bacillaceae]|uniref:endolytic transglycosylase MltG n=1 Tax=Bacillaceae TaxID=186817 RepID=UPI001E3A36C7|nr:MULTISPECIES: endolytic transglycosylase MltG [Bacillaceae]MCE4047725.1 endolytic transglycosylase MltG [Bacillus sp. Au-Bac7]MCM3031172.1 endolytic transglycosylase MltG [Niallia sp. MER 6]MDL0434749.1 endolytic transglycosylase MltG [Niallia sp. SS-2023]UPO85939.1 endolytic transglycosylase MltG [Niallia sp. Man26]